MLNCDFRTAQTRSRTQFFSRFTFPSERPSWPSRSGGEARRGSTRRPSPTRGRSSLVKPTQVVVQLGPLCRLFILHSRCRFHQLSIFAAVVAEQFPRARIQPPDQRESGRVAEEGPQRRRAVLRRDVSSGVPPSPRPGEPRLLIVPLRMGVFQLQGLIQFKVAK